MDGKQFVDILAEFGLQLEPVTKNQWRGKRTISPTILRNGLRKFEHQNLSLAVEPVVEFHKLNMNHGNSKDTFAKRIDDESIVRKLKDNSGVYAFYESQGRLVYVGKTVRNNLLSEMTQRYGGKKVPFKILKQGKAKHGNSCIKDVATYFSAYRVHKLLISNIEALLMRVIMNTASNIHVESFQS